MPIISGVTLETTKIRSTPGGDVITGSIPKDTHITADDSAGSWLKLITVNGTAKGGYVNIRSIKINTNAPPPPPPPTPNLTPFTLTVDGYKPYIGDLEKL